MSKSHYGDIVALLEWADKKKTETKGWGRRRKEKSAVEKLVATFLEDQLRDKVKEMTEKINKKEDKPKGWESLSFIQKMTILTATVPIATMLYGLAFLQVFVAAGHILGMK